jgi:F420-dependent hydroxymycolic acid dehydrogenase
MRLAGQHADGLVTDPLTWKQHKSEWESGARAAGKDPGAMPVLVEQYVVVGGSEEAKQAAELWRFGPKAFKGYFNILDPAAIQRVAEKEIPVERSSKVGRSAPIPRHISQGSRNCATAAPQSSTSIRVRPIRNG